MGLLPTLLPADAKKERATWIVLRGRNERRNRARSIKAERKAIS